MFARITVVVVCLAAFAVGAKPSTQQQQTPVKESAAATTQQLKDNARALETLARLIAELKQAIKDTHDGSTQSRITPNRSTRSD